MEQNVGIKNVIFHVKKKKEGLLAATAAGDSLGIWQTSKISQKLSTPWFAPSLKLSIKFARKKYITPTVYGHPPARTSFSSS
jgi:hypothetical protein